MVNRFVLVAVFVPLAIILVALAVANRGVTPFTLDPFNPGNPGLTLHAPLFVLLFASVAIGLIVGSLATWLRQGRYRRLARRREQELQDLRRASPESTARPQQAERPALPRPAA